jgi:hypothetical protein
MSRALDDLDPRFKPLAIALLARCVEARVAVLIVDTLRTPAEHAINLAAGTSWVARSTHLDGLAIDLVPYELYTAAPGGDKLAWAAAHPLWPKIGAIGEALGLRWGGRWTIPDLGHFEYVSDTVSSATLQAAQTGIHQSSEGLGENQS